MVSTDSALVEADERPADQHERALAVASDGLKMILDEGPPVEPTYPDSGSVEAHEAWAFDSASHERAQTAREALEDVEAIVGDQTPAG